MRSIFILLILQFILHNLIYLMKCCGYLKYVIEYISFSHCSLFVCLSVSRCVCVYLLAKYFGKKCSAMQKYSTFQQVVTS